MKTQALQILDRLSIPYEVREFQEEELTAEEAAIKLDLPLDTVFKTLVVRGSATGVFLACVPGSCGLSLRKLARASGDKTVEMVRVDEVHGLTGYHRGGCSPLGARKPYPVFIDETVFLCERVCVSAGMRGMQMLLEPGDLIRAAAATVADIAE